MPFGRIFGAFFFGFCAWAGFRELATGAAILRLSGALLGCFALALGLALLGRAHWARGAGMFGAIGLAGLAAVSAVGGEGGMSFALTLAGLLTLALLALPATGKLAPDAAAPGAGARALGWLAVSSLVGLALAAPWAYRARIEEAPSAAATPVSQERPGRIEWADFGSGLDRARSEDKLLLVFFDASWCGYCKKMNRNTWKQASVIERASADVVPVRVDIDDTRDRNGFSGSDLASKYRIRGTPTTLLVDHDGEVLSRAGGYKTARQILTWLDQSLRGAVRLSANP